MCLSKFVVVLRNDDEFSIIIKNQTIMKSKHLIIAVAVLLFNSCIIKSLQPFYTEDTLVKYDKLIGSWDDNKGGTWDIKSFEEEHENEKKQFINITDKDDLLYKKFIKGYYASYTRDDKKAEFIVMPFKIDNHYFIDFMPFMFDDDVLNPLLAEHLQITHSVSKLDIEANGAFSLTWLNESKIEDLITKNMISIKHEKMGIEESPLLTASSEELTAFLKKYMNSNINDKWKKSDQLSLTLTHAKH